MTCIVLLLWLGGKETQTSDMAACDEEKSNDSCLLFQHAAREAGYRVLSLTHPYSPWRKGVACYAIWA